MKSIMKGLLVSAISMTIHIMPMHRAFLASGQSNTQICKPATVANQKTTTVDESNLKALLTISDHRLKQAMKDKLSEREVNYSCFIAFLANVEKQSHLEIIADLLLKHFYSMKENAKNMPSKAVLKSLYAVVNGKQGAFNAKLNKLVLLVAEQLDSTERSKITLLQNTSTLRKHALQNALKIGQKQSTPYVEPQKSELDVQVDEAQQALTDAQARLESVRKQRVEAQSLSDFDEDLTLQLVEEAEQRIVEDCTDKFAKLSKLQELARSSDQEKELTSQAEKEVGEHTPEQIRERRLEIKANRSARLESETDEEKAERIRNMRMAFEQRREAKKKAKLEAQQKALEEAERKRKEEEDTCLAEAELRAEEQARIEAEKQAQEEAERKRGEEEEACRAAETKRQAEEQARIVAERKAQEEAKRKRKEKEDAGRAAEAKRQVEEQAKIEAEQRAREEAERKRKEKEKIQYTFKKVHKRSKKSETHVGSSFKTKGLVALTGIALSGLIGKYYITEAKLVSNNKDIDPT